MHTRLAVFIFLTLGIFSLSAYATSPSGMPGAVGGSAGTGKIGGEEEPYQPPEVIGSREAVCPTPPAMSNTNRPCTMMACMDGLNIHIDPEYRWKPGHYVFTFNAGGKTSTCTGNLPLGNCGQASLKCTARWAQIMESGCALPKDAQGFGDITVNGYVKQFSVSITREGKSIANQTFTPNYRGSQPNGAGCAPACCQANISLPLR